MVEGDALRSRAFGQWTREIPVTAARGEIYDANGVLLADNAAAYAVYARPNAVKDKRRAAYHRFYTNMKWGDAHNYDISLNSGKIGIEKCVSIIKNLYKS